MPGEQDDEAPARQAVTSGRDAYVAGRDLHLYLPPAQSPILTGNVYLGGGYERLDDAMELLETLNPSMSPERAISGAKKDAN